MADYIYHSSIPAAWKGPLADFVYSFKSAKKGIYSMMRESPNQFMPSHFWVLWRKEREKEVRKKGDQSLEGRTRMEVYVYYCYYVGVKASNGLLTLNGWPFFPLTKMNTLENKT